MYTLKDIRSVHVELSTDCNASCPVCNRNLYGGKTHPWIPKAQITLEDFKKFFSSNFIKQLHFIMFCGNYGDPAMGRDLVEIVEYIYTCNREITIQINTNAGTRSSTFWSQLGKMIKAPSNITFSIDGLEDTNHIYRRGVKWISVLNSLKAFIDSGGNAHWDFLVFKHNEHQVEEAREFANNIGINKFIPKKAFGFISKGNKQSVGVYNTDGNLDYDIYPPSKEYQNREYTKIKESAQINISNPKIGPNDSYYNDSISEVTRPYMEPNYTSHLSNLDIDCYSLKQNEIFISAEGLVFPCCFTASRLYGLNKNEHNNWQFQNHVSNFNRSDFCLHSNRLEDVLESDFLDNSFKKSWSCKDLKSGKLGICSEFCGKNRVELESVFDLN
jgi:MoaA/NifB/PqqE/SkfB family radical SAM enzyme